MKKFSELSEPEQIKYVKFAYIDIIGEIHSKKEDITKYLPDLGATATAEEKAARTAEREAAQAKISTIVLKTDCMCVPKELEIDVNYIVPELEVFVDFARERAESVNY